jgi:hypothetical protein
LGWQPLCVAVVYCCISTGPGVAVLHPCATGYVVLQNYGCRGGGGWGEGGGGLGAGGAAVVLYTCACSADTVQVVCRTYLTSYTVLCVVSAVHWCGPVCGHHRAAPPPLWHP